MIIVELKGGLGNQMFQYAIARILAHKHNTELLIDISAYSYPDGYDPNSINVRLYELDVFNIHGQTTTDKPNKKLIKIRKEQKLRKAASLCLCKVVNAFSDSFMPMIYERKNVGFDGSLLDLPDNIFLRGYFPSFKYFEANRDIIKKDFTFAAPPDSENKKMIDQITSVNSVSMHIRRGDYITNQRVTDKFGLCSMGYYKKAMDHISQKVEAPHFFVFSNDPQWVKDNIKTDHTVTYITHNKGQKGFEDLRLISSCKHNVIANSSFSWWGAWLNDNPKKIVIAPSPVFDKLLIDDDDFIPKDWIRIAKND
ncbi:MAG: alpha-1,2-fucosyltransferase [Sedimentisphaerales bacterium]|nr:alpha-1,2-fucosyltransferase [Sedimentisphaerales bacterium]